jgi:glutamate carboxypeptidase
LELAHKITAIQSLTNLETGITFNVGVVRGGTRPNIIPDWAEAEIDLRIKTGSQEQEALRQIEAVVEHNWIEGTRSLLEGGITRPPLPPTPGNLRLFHDLQKIGLELGLKLDALESGGGSDANLVAQLGIPVLDGLGPVGGGHHSEEEYLEIPSLYPRIQLLSEYLSRLSK